MPLCVARGSWHVRNREGNRMPTKRRSNGAGAVRQLPSGRWQARHRGPDGVMRPAPQTFDTRLDATAWLAGQVRDVDRGAWVAPQPVGEAQGAPTLRSYSASWLAARELKPRTRELYRDLLAGHILPGLGDVELTRLTPQGVRNWHAGMDPSTPTRRAHAYSLLRTIMATAVSDDLTATNPCRIRGAGTARTQHTTRVASLGELELMVAACPEPRRPLLLLAAWAGLRFGELAELRRKDLDLDAGVVRVQRGVTRAAGKVFVGTPKTAAGRRTVALPPHLLPVLERHLRIYTGPGPDELLFPATHGGHLAGGSSLQAIWHPARAAAGREDLHFHDLRHMGATLAAATGATLADLMSRLGHSTPSAALRYQHAVADRDRAIAEALSGFADARVVPLRRAN